MGSSDFVTFAVEAVIASVAVRGRGRAFLIVFAVVCGVVAVALRVPAPSGFVPLVSGETIAGWGRLIFGPVIIAIVAVMVIGIRQDIYGTMNSAAEGLLKVLDRHTPDASPEDFPAPSVEGQPSDRVFLPSSVNDRTLGAMTEGKMGVESARIVQPYIGKWMALTAIVDDIRASGRGSMVWFRDSPNGGLRRVHAYFEPDWNDRLHMLPRSAKLSLVGRVRRINNGGVELEDCEIV